MPIQPRCPILREKPASMPVQDSARSTGLRSASSAARKARTSWRRASASGHGGGGGKLKAFTGWVLGCRLPAGSPVTAEGQGMRLRTVRRRTNLRQPSPAPHRKRCNGSPLRGLKDYGRTVRQPRLTLQSRLSFEPNNVQGSAGSVPEHAVCGIPARDVGRHRLYRARAYGTKGITMTATARTAAVQSSLLSDNRFIQVSRFKVTILI